MNRVLAGNPLARLLFITARMLVLVYVGLSLYLAFFQRRALYYPERVVEAELIPLAAWHGLIPWRNGHGDYIGWQPATAPPRGADLLLVFHGNAGFALHRTYLVDGFRQPPAAPALQVFLMEYPGYGPRPGTPSEAAFQVAAAEALTQLRQDHPGSRIFVVGESIGSGVACALAGEYPEQIAGIFLITAFNRLADVARHHYPILPVGLLLRDRFESSQALTRYHGPVGVLLAGDDQVIPPELGKRLHEDYQGPKQLWIQAGSGHNTLDYGTSAPWWSEATAFLLAHAPPKPAHPLDSSSEGLRNP